MDAAQLALPFDSRPLVAPDKGLTREERFRQFHERNPQVYAWLVNAARQVKARGRVVGMRLLIERLRWEIALSIDRAGDAWRINNDYAPRFARLIMAQEGDLAGFFETRERGDDEREAA